MDALKCFKRHDGYMDMQMPPVILGIIILVSLVLVITNPEVSSKVSATKVYIGFGIAFSAIGFGFFINKDSLSCPESPFNKHVSPVFLAACVLGALAFAIWKVIGTPNHFFVYIFGAAIAVTIIVAIYLCRVLSKTTGGAADSEN